LFFWQPLQCFLTSLEVWLALYFLGARVTLVEAVVIESLIQAIGSAAFFVPGGLGVQEGGFILIGGALGLDPSTCLALAGARRIRDLLIFVPGLLAWQFAETSKQASVQSSTPLASRAEHPRVHGEAARGPRQAPLAEGSVAGETNRR
ncbi:lysylphosphatidylglycerol synthase domain-containing protein, partial [Paraburkholderia kirstenboschensis]|uniref:lysylphosphatidylglycerol synthase domain-containing protein n=1 Tax=Paraburkholderia kirstenboschensis TaxID=1245436 RepID=UPI000A9D1F6F